MKLSSHVMACLFLVAGFMLPTQVSADPIPIDSLARMPAISGVSMSADGKQLVAIVAAPGSDYRETALATMDLDNLDAPPGAQAERALREAVLREAHQLLHGALPARAARFYDALREEFTPGLELTSSHFSKAAIR